MILVTGAAGKTGRSVIKALAAKGQTVRALVHHTRQASAVRDAGAQDIIAGDMRDQAVVDQATGGVRAIYHICPNMSRDEFSIGQVIVKAASANGIEHVVYHSVLHPQTEAMPHHWQKLRTEELLFESGLAYTILQPAAYMQNLLAYWDQIVRRGIYAVPYAADTRLSMVDLEDIAQAAVVVLTETGHMGATYELVGADALTPAEIAANLEQHLDRPVRAEAMPLDVWEEGARASGLGEYQVETLLQMFRYYERYGFWGNPNVLTWLLRRPPATFASFVECAAMRMQDASGGSKP
ncbi:MAG: SDR family oxidoreductase [Anaerolineae bacterium]